MYSLFYNIFVVRAVPVRSQPVPSHIVDVLPFPLIKSSACGNVRPILLCHHCSHCADRTNYKQRQAELQESNATCKNTCGAGEQKEKKYLLLSIQDGIEN